MTDDEMYTAIPGRILPPVCPDCGCHPHWKTECHVCGCPDGPTRKRQRDAEHVSGHGPGGDRTPTGFA